MPALTVDLNQEGLHDLSVPSGFLAHGRFRIEVRNHGSPTHVHVGLDDALSRVASIEEPNHFVGEEEALTIDVRVRSIESPVSGVLTVATAHGAEKKYVNVTIEPPEERREESTVEVDERLAEPPDRDQGGDSIATTVRSALSAQLAGVSPALLVLAAIVILLVLGLSFQIGGTTVFLGAVLVVVGAIAVVIASIVW